MHSEYDCYVIHRPTGEQSGQFQINLELDGKDVLSEEQIKHLADGQAIQTLREEVFLLVRNQILSGVIADFGMSPQQPEGHTTTDFKINNKCQHDYILETGTLAAQTRASILVNFTATQALNPAAALANLKDNIAANIAHDFTFGIENTYLGKESSNLHCRISSVGPALEDLEECRFEEKM